ncbi:hypothetical protein BU17DRAFT_61001 [Hysterangium stoloniferum]|nr:hypothetical protein BU17DRAFT_61001 [Hysterangium stoloniferum]
MTNMKLKLSSDGGGVENVRLLWRALQEGKCKWVKSTEAELAARILTSSPNNTALSNTPNAASSPDNTAPGDTPNAASSHSDTPSSNPPNTVSSAGNDKSSTNYVTSVE